MKMFGQIKALDRREEELIHQTVLRIVDKVGMIIESREMLERLAALGGKVDFGKMTVRFSPSFVEEFIASSDRFDWENIKPHVRAGADITPTYYLNPETNEFEKWRLDTILRHLKVAHYLEHTKGMGNICYAVPLEGVPAEAELLFSHYLQFKTGGTSSCSLNDIKWCPAIMEMCEAVAQEKGLKPASLCKGVHVHIINPLKLGAEEAKIIMYFAERGLEIGIGNMSSAGGTAPVTLAGAVALHLAQDIFINIIKRVFFDRRNLILSGALSPMDMRSLMYPYARPEKMMSAVALSHMARRYGAEPIGHTGFTDAKRPGWESGFQKAFTSLPLLMICGRTSIDCGTLSVDEIFSPIQMILDNEIVSALKYYVQGFEINEDTLAYDVIAEIGPSGNFLNTGHTLEHFRAAQWEPKICSRDMFGSWIRAGAKIDTDRALEIYRDIMQRPDLPPRVSEATERKLLEIIRETTGAVLQPVSLEVK